MFPSINQSALLTGESYTLYSATPPNVTCNITDDVVDPEKSVSATKIYDANAEGTPCTLGIDEAGRGPVIGPMVYSAFYLPSRLHPELLTSPPNVFKDSKTLTSSSRAQLMQSLCTQGTDLHECCGWAVRSLSAPSISEGKLKKNGEYNLNEQAMDATIEIIKGVLSKGINIKEIFVDTLGPPVTHRQKLERIFPTIKIVVEKKADSLYPVVSAASIVAKVTRDVSCDMLYEYIICQPTICNGADSNEILVEKRPDWGSGYPSDTKCTTWLRREMNPLFGWGRECRFSWATATDMLENADKDASGIQVIWPVDEDEESMRVTDFYSIGSSIGGPMCSETSTEDDSLRHWFGSKASHEAF